MELGPALLTLGTTVAFVGLLMVGMAIGVIVSNRRLAGSCGGASSDCICEKRKRGACPIDRELGRERELEVASPLD